MSAPPTPVAPVTPEVPVAGVTGGGASALTSGARWLAGATVLIGLVNYGFTVGMTHLLTSSGFAAFAAGQALVLTAGTVAANSGAWVLAHSLVEARTPLERHRATWFSVALNAGVGALGGVTAALVALTFTTPATAAVIGACVLLVFLSCVSFGLLRGQLRFGALAGLNVAEAVVKVVAGAVVVALGAGAGGALGGIAAGSLVVVAVGVAVGRRDLLPVSGSLRSGGLWRHAVSATSVQGAVAVLGSVDTVVVAAVVSDSGAAASYQAAMALSRIPLFLAGAVAASVHPLVVRDPDGSGPVVRQAVRMYLSVTLPFAVALACAPPQLLRLVLPADYVARLAPLLPLTAAAGALIGVVALVATVMLSRGAAARSATAQGVGLVVLLVALLVGTTTAGTTGAAVGVLVGSAASLAALAAAVPAAWRGSLAPPRREVALAALAVVVLLVLRDEVWLWLAVAAAAGALGVLRAFGGTRTAPVAGQVGLPGDPRATTEDDPEPAVGPGRRLKVLHLAFQDWRMPGSGGGAVRTREVDERLAARHDVTALVCSYPGAAERVENGVRWVPVGLPLGRFGAIATYFAALPSAVRRHSADVVVEDFGAPIGSIGPRLRAGRPLVALVQWLNAEEKAAQYRLPFHWVQRRGLRHHRTFIVTSGDLRDRVHQDNPAAHVVVVPNGVPREAFDVRAQRGHDVVFLGRLEVAQKGLDLLLEAFAAVADRLPGDLVVAGDGPDLAAVRSRAARLGVAHRVRLVGRVEGAAKLDLLASALLVAMPSRFETFGMVAAEAAACGTPVVAFAIPSLREVVVPETGVLVPAFDVAAFADALAELAADPARVERLGESGRERARRWDWDDIALQHEAVYAAAAGPVGVPGRQP